MFPEKTSTSLDNYRSGDIAAYYGYLSLIKHNINLLFTKDAMNWVAERDHLDVVKWLHQNRKEGCTTNAMDLAANNGHLDVVKWLHRNRREGCTKAAMTGAAGNGHLEIVEWLHRNRKERDCFIHKTTREDVQHML